MNTGAYAEYRANSFAVVFLNDTGSFTQMDNPTITYSWTCEEANDTIATLKIQVQFETEEGQVTLSNVVYVRFLDRMVFFANGTIISQTRLWVDGNPVQNQQITLLDTTDNKLVGYVNGATDPPIRYQTLQGFQKCFMLNGNGTLDKNPINGFTMIYDFNTGLLLNGTPMDNEPTLLSLGIESITIAPAKLQNTNIDLGPSDILLDIQAFLPVVAIVTAFILIMVGVYYTKRKKGKSRKK